MQAWSLKVEEVLASSDSRMDQKSAEVFNECRDKLQAWTLGMEGNIGQSSKDLESKCRVAFDEILAQVANQKEFLKQVEGRILQIGVAGGAGTGFGSGRGSSNSELSPKDVRVDKLADKIDVIEFRRWQKTVELQLEHCFGKRPMEEIILALRHTREPITSAVWTGIMVKMNDNDSHKILPHEWDFDEQSRFLYTYLFPKLNTSLVETIANVTEQNGFEVIRLINDKMDRIPRNAKFHMNFELGDFLRNKDGSLKKSKDVVASSDFVHLFNAEFTRYKKMVG